MFFRTKFLAPGLKFCRLVKNYLSYYPETELIRFKHLLSQKNLYRKNEEETEKFEIELTRQNGRIVIIRNKKM